MVDTPVCRQCWSTEQQKQELPPTCTTAMFLREPPQSEMFCRGLSCDGKADLDAVSFSAFSSVREARERDRERAGDSGQLTPFESVEKKRQADMVSASQNITVVSCQPVPSHTEKLSVLWSPQVTLFKLTRYWWQLCLYNLIWLLFRNSLCAIGHCVHCCSVVVTQTPYACITIVVTNTIKLLITLQMPW